MALINYCTNFVRPNMWTIAKDPLVTLNKLQKIDSSLNAFNKLRFRVQTKLKHPALG